MLKCFKYLVVSEKTPTFAYGNRDERVAAAIYKCESSTNQHYGLIIN